jgi:hypothetical protein
VSRAECDAGDVGAPFVSGLLEHLRGDVVLRFPGEEGPLPLAREAPIRDLSIPFLGVFQQAPTGTSAPWDQTLA